MRKNGDNIIINNNIINRELIATEKRVEKFRDEDGVKKRTRNVMWKREMWKPIQSSPKFIAFISRVGRMHKSLSIKKS